ncbi:hypothetical protein BD408DRAFT_402716 [Parasitella parasitica]|nr:hypothetical protein BD408DRAFT_402716 [Parasitella parasitica]
MVVSKRIDSKHGGTWIKAIAQVLTITNSYPDPIFKSFFENLPWQFCYYSFACYLFGVAHTVCNVLKQQIAKNENRPAFVQNVKAAMFKILMTMLIAIATLMTSIIFEVLTILKVNTSQNYHLTLAMYIINAFNIILAILFKYDLSHCLNCAVY